MKHPAQTIRNRTVFTFLITFVCLYVLSLFCFSLPADYNPPYDCREYLTLSRSFLKNGSFSFDTYPLSIRGCLFPLLLLALQTLLPFLTPNQCIVLMNCATFSLFASFGIKVFLGNFTKTGGWNRLRFCAFIALYLLYWNDLIRYGRTDFYAFWWLLIAILLVEKVRLGEISPLFTAFLGLLSGFFAYAAYNFRPNFSFSVIALFVYVFILFISNIRKFGWFVPLFLAGALIAAVPQMLINHVHSGSFTPLIPTGNYDGQSLTMFYLNNGLTMRRYETYVGSKDIRQWGAMVFTNEPMARLLEAEGITAFAGLGDYVLFVLKHPFECIAVYAEHLVNLLTPVFGQIYVTNFYGLKIPRILLNFALYALVAGDWLLRLRDGEKPLQRMHQKGVLSPIVILFISILPVIAGKVEARYALGVYVLVYLYVCWHVDFKRMWQWLRRHPVITLIFVGIILMLYLTILAGTLATHDGPMVRLL